MAPMLRIPEKTPWRQTIRDGDNNLDTRVGASPVSVTYTLSEVGNDFELAPVEPLMAAPKSRRQLLQRANSWCESPKPTVIGQEKVTSKQSVLSNGQPYQRERKDALFFSEHLSPLGFGHMNRVDTLDLSSDHTSQKSDDSKLIIDQPQNTAPRMLKWTQDKFGSFVKNTLKRTSPATAKGVMLSDDFTEPESTSLELEQRQSSSCHLVSDTSDTDYETTMATLKPRKNLQRSRSFSDLATSIAEPTTPEPKKPESLTGVHSSKSRRSRRNHALSVSEHTPKRSSGENRRRRNNGQASERSSVRRSDTSTTITETRWSRRNPPANRRLSSGSSELGDDLLNSSWGDLTLSSASGDANANRKVRRGKLPESKQKNNHYPTEVPQEHLPQVWVSCEEDIGQNETKKALISPSRRSRSSSRSRRSHRKSRDFGARNASDDMVLMEGRNKIRRASSMQQSNDKRDSRRVSRVHSTNSSGEGKAAQTNVKGNKLGDAKRDFAEDKRKPPSLKDTSEKPAFKRTGSRRQLLSRNMRKASSMRNLGVRESVEEMQTPGLRKTPSTKELKW